ALLVAQGQHPGQFRSDIAARSPVRPRDPARRQPRATNRWTARSICREETLQGGPREPAVATRRCEHPNAAGIAPTAQGGRRDAEHVACLREAYPLWVAGRRASHQTYSNLPEHCRLAHFTTCDATGSSTTAARDAAGPNPPSQQLMQGVSIAPNAVRSEVRGWTCQPPRGATHAAIPAFRPH